jgi:hypothetical protein
MLLYYSGTSRMPHIMNLFWKRRASAANSGALWTPGTPATWPPTFRRVAPGGEHRREHRLRHRGARGRERRGSPASGELRRPPRGRHRGPVALAGGNPRGTSSKPPARGTAGTMARFGKGSGAVRRLLAMHHPRNGTSRRGPRNSRFPGNFRGLGSRPEVRFPVECTALCHGVFSWLRNLAISWPASRCTSPNGYTAPDG